MTLEELEKFIADESKISDISLDKDSFRIPVLHSKLLIMRANVKKELRELEFKHDQLTLFKRNYYTGKCSTDELKAKNLLPFSKKVLSSDVDQYLKSDPELFALSKAKEECLDKIEVLDNAIKEVQNRNWTIRNIIEWTKFQTGA